MSAQQDNSNRTINVSTCQHVKLDSLGTGKPALLFHVIQDLHSLAHAIVVRPQFTHAHQVPIGMVIDVSILLTSAPLV